MIIRILIILGCVVVFINGCNSLISQHFGTHKLRGYTMEEVQQSGVGDADFIEVENAVLSGDFVFKAAKSPTNPGVIIYPVLSREQLAAHNRGETVSPNIIAWTTDFPSQCVEAGNCIKAGPLALKGIVRNLPDDRQGQGQLEEKGYRVADSAIYLDHGQAPLAWYWNLLLMLGAAAAIFGIEAYSHSRQRKRAAEKK
ncbi:MAG: hypothetical protein H6557_33220 [Lewinellaceae bacterium]|nr:hypothetical protein [Phaeodactylibacter sp.]MCB9041507.1 hypothetical protein [Lewinellaceae bacterium]